MTVDNLKMSPIFWISFFFINNQNAKPFLLNPETTRLQIIFKFNYIPKISLYTQVRDDNNVLYITHHDLHDQ